MILRPSIAVLAACLTAACGNDGSATSGGEGSGGAAAQPDGSASSGGAAGTAAGGADAGAPPAWPSSTTAPPTSVICEGAPCEGSGGLTPCCTNAGACGAQYLGKAGAGCVIVNDPGLIDPACPMTDEGAGCCRSDGFCGAFYSTTFGCIDPEAFPSSGTLVKVPCTRTP